MQNSVITIPDELFAPAESATFTGTFDLPELVLGADTYTFKGPLSWNIVVSNTGGSLLVSGLVKGEAVTTCVRCLDPAEYCLEGEVEGFFTLPGVEVELTEEEREESEPLNEDHTIDLAPLFIAALSLELPQTPLCDEDCKGICAGCGANLNHEDCTCDKSQTEDEFHSSPFAVLKNITFE